MRRRHGVLPSALADRGPARHFHGREREWKSFVGWLEEVENGRRGSAMVLVQGAPGAGKTALLNKFGERAEERGWRVLESIDCDVLHNPAALAELAGVRYVTGETHEKQLGTGVDARIPFVGAATVERGGTRAKSYAPSPVSGVVESLVGRRDEGLLLIIDEVQDVALTQDRNERKKISKTLRWIHNGHANVAVVLLMGGLGNSHDELLKLGVSRLLSEGGLINLGRMEAGATRNVLRDWLNEIERVRQAPNVVLDHWVTTLADECDRWPQHMHSYVYPAWLWLQEHEGAMPYGVPDMVLAHGRRRKDEYYLGRVSAMQSHHLHALTSLLARKKDAGYLFTEVELMAAFSAATSTDDPHGYLMSPPDAFRKARKTGVVDMVSETKLGIPIPSMRRWLGAAYDIDLGLPASGPREDTFANDQAAQDEKKTIGGQKPVRTGGREA